MRARLDRRAMLAGAAAAAALAASPALARAVTLIVPYPPGGAVDLLGRLIAEKLRANLGEVVVENRGGAGGSIGTAALAKAPADGATLGLLNVTQFIVNKYLHEKLPYDPDADLTPISRVATGTILCVARADVARERSWRSLRDLIAWSRANPDQVRMGSSGVGTISHLGLELVKARSGASITHVPYKGGGPALVDLLGGVVEIMFDVPPILIPHVRDGTLIALGVGSRERIPALPDTPSMKEFSDVGLGEVDVQTWYAVAAPKGLPDERRDKIYDALAAAMAAEDVAERLRPLGFAPVIDAYPGDLAKRIERENPMWEELVRISGAKAE